MKSKKYEWDAYLFLLPAALIIITFRLAPLIYTLILGFFKYDVPAPPKFIGLYNYKVLFSDPEFWLSLKNTIYYVLFSLPLQVLIPLFIAMLLNNKLKGIDFYRIIYYLPVITSVNAVALVWKWLYAKEAGLLNYFMSLIGIGKIDFLNESAGILKFVADGIANQYQIKIFQSFIDSVPAFFQGPSVAMMAIVVMSVWKGLGSNILIFLAGLQNVPRHLYEAAEIDGATIWHKFWYITWPLISPTTYFVLVMSTINSFQVFAQVYMMTPLGGPMKTTTVIVFYLYQKAFQHFEMGFAAAVACVLFFIILAMTIIQKLTVEKKVHYS